MPTVNFRTNVDAGKRLVNQLNDRIDVRHNSLNPLIGDTIVVHSDSGCKIKMVVCGRNWQVVQSAVVLEIELTVPDHFTISSFTKFVQDSGLPVH
jgi:hypothetical protein